MKKISLAIFALLSIASFAGSDNNSTEIHNNIANLPVLFRQNMGQWDSKVLYSGVSPSWNANVQFMKNGLSFGFSREVEDEKHQVLIWNMYFENANLNPTVRALGQTESKTNYIKGNDPAKWQSNVPDHRYIKYENIYPNTDVQYYGTGKELKYDFILNPGANINNIKLKFDGINSLQINHHGILEINTAWGILTEEIPVSYQLINGERIEIPVSYALGEDGKSFGFKVNGNYNKSIPLIIDPVNLKWGTYVGQVSTFNDGYLYGIDVDANENVYTTGYYNDQFPTTPGAYDQTHNGGLSAGNTPDSRDVLVCKLNSTGTAIIYATYIGGSGDDLGLGIKVNTLGEVFVIGATSNASFPTTTGPAFGTSTYEVFCAKLNASGNNLLYSTFLGCETNPYVTPQGPYGMGLAINSANEAYIVGNTTNLKFTPTGGVVGNAYSGIRDAFMVKLSNTGAISIATYLGGSDEDYATDVEVDASNNIYITGYTKSIDLPVTGNAYSSSNAGAFDAYVYKLNASATSITYGTYIGGIGSDYSRGIALNSSNEIIIAGTLTGSNNYPTTAGSYDPTFNGGYEGFITKFNASGTALDFSTYLGSVSTEYLTDVKVNSLGEIYVAGFTSSSIFPTTSCAFQPTYSSGPGIQFDFFLSKFNSTGSSLVYSTYLGGNSLDYRQPSIVLIPGTSGCGDDDVIFGGTTHSDDYDVKTGYNFVGTILTVNNNTDKANQDIPVVFRHTPPVPEAEFTYVPSAASSCMLPAVDFTENSIGCTNGNYQWNFGDPASGVNNTSTLQNPTHVYPAPGLYNVTLIVSCPSDTIVKQINVDPVNNPLSLASVVENTSCGRVDGSITLTAGGNTAPINYVWSPNLGTGNAYDSLIAGIYTVTIYDTTSTGTGCSKTIIDTILASTLPLTTIYPNNVICPNTADGAIDLEVAQGLPTYTYDWSIDGTGDNDDTQDQTNVPAGTYTVTVIDSAGCTVIDSITITQPPLVPIILSASRNDTVCVAGSASELSVVIDSLGNNGLNYVWTPGGIANTDTINVSPTSSQYYYVTATDGCGKTKTDSVLVTILSVPNSVTNTSCALNNGVIAVNPIGAAGNVTYSWTPNLGTGNSYNGLQAGSYAVTVTDQGSGCSQTLSFNINTSTLPDPNISFTNVSCPSGTNGSADLSVTSGTPGYSYNWNGGAYSSEDLSNVAAGTYTVVITDAANCTVIDSVTITQPPVSPIVLSVSQPDTVCAGDAGNGNVSVVSGGYYGYSYVWTPGGATTSSIISVSPVGNQTYTVIVTDGCGQTKTDSITINVQTLPNASAVTAAGLGAGVYYLEDTAVFVNQSTGATSWLWDFGDGNTSTAQNPTHVYGATGIYTVTLYATNNFGCPDSLLLIVEIKQEELIEVPNVFTPNSDTFNDWFVINNKGVKEYHIIIYDRWGLKMFESSETQLHWDGVVQSTGRFATDGTYYYILNATFISETKYESKGYLQLIR